MRTGVIAVTNPGHVAATGFVENALANNPSCAGFAIFSDGKLVIDRMKNPDKDMLNSVFNGCKDFQVNAFLGNYPDGFLEDDIQPFVLVEDENKNPVVAVMLDGDWVNTGPTGSNHSDEFFVAINQLRPMVQQLYRLTKGDIGAMLEEIDTDATKQNIVNTFIGRGSVHFMFNTGQHRTVVKNTLEMEYPWGWVSNHFGYTEDQKPAEKSTEKPSILLSLLGSRALPKTAPTMTVEPKTEEVKPPPTVILPGETVKMVQCPQGTTKPYKVEKWYRENAHWVPENYMSYPKVEVRPKIATGPIKDLKDLPKVLNTSPTATVLPDVKSTPEDIAKRTPPKQVTGPKILPPVQLLEQPKPVVVEPKKDTVPSMTPESQKNIVDHWLKNTASMVTTTDRSGNPITDPKDVAALDTKYADFSERLGIKFEDTFSWKVERLEKLMKEFPDAALHLMCNYRQRLATMMKASSLVADAPKKIVLPKLKTG